MKSQHTLCVHEGSVIESKLQSLTSPIYISTSYGYLDTEDDYYIRFSNLPNHESVEKKMCALERAEAGLVLSTGMGVITTTLLAHLKSGDHIIVQKRVFFISSVFIDGTLKKLGIESSETEGCEVADFECLIQENTKAILFESPTNPLLSITDIKAVADLAKKHNLITFFDNTYATPINQNPIDLGVDIVLHSATKFLNGHGDLCAGFVVGSQALIQPIRALSRVMGGCLNSQMCRLLERSLQTLALRIERSNENAMAIAQFLQNHDEVRTVYYPGLPTHKDYHIAKSQMRGFGGIVCFEVDESIDVIKFQSNLKIIRIANSFGELTSSLNAQALAIARFSGFTPELVKKKGLTNQSIRMSVGIEGLQDLLQDLELALKASKSLMMVTQ